MVAPTSQPLRNVNPNLAVVGDALIAYGADGCSRSTDGARTWHVVSDEPLRAVSGEHAIGERGFYRSTDGWRTLAHTQAQKVGFVAAIATHGSAAWATQHSMLFRLDGDRWRRVTTGTRGALGVLCVTERLVLVPGLADRVLRYEIAEDAWTEVITGARFTRIVALGSGFVATERERTTLWVSADGRDWKRRGDAGSKWDIVAADGELFTTSARGISRSPDPGIYWELEVPGREVSRLAVGDVIWGITRAGVTIFRARPAAI